MPMELLREHVLLIPEHSLPSGIEPTAVTVASRARKEVLSIVEREWPNHRD